MQNIDYARPKSEASVICIDNKAPVKTIKPQRLY